RLQPYQSRRVVKDRSHVLGSRRAAGVGVAQPARILFLQREPRTECMAGRQRQQRCADGGRQARTTECTGFHVVRPPVSGLPLVRFSWAAAGRRALLITIHRPYASRTGRPPCKSRPCRLRSRGYSGGSSRGRRSGPTATKVRHASVTLTQIILPGLRSAYTCTSTVTDVRPT